MKKIWRAILQLLNYCFESFLDFFSAKCPECQEFLEVDEAAGEITLTGDVAKKCPKCGWRSHEAKAEEIEEPP